MNTEQALAFFLFSLAAAGTPGPSNVLLTATGAIAGIRGGLPCLAGVTIGMGLMMFLVALGLGSALLDHPKALTVMNWAGAAMLFWLSWKIATAGRTDVSARGDDVVGFLPAAGFQWVNPKSWLVCTSAAGTYLVSDGGESAMLQSAIFGGLFIAASGPACFVWLAFGSAMQRLLSTDRSHRIFNMSMGGLLALSVLMILF